MHRNYCNSATSTFTQNTSATRLATFHSQTFSSRSSPIVEDRERFRMIPPRNYWETVLNPTSIDAQYSRLVNPPLCPKTTRTYWGTVLGRSPTPTSTENRNYDWENTVFGPSQKKPRRKTYWEMRFDEVYPRLPLTNDGRCGQCIGATFAATHENGGLSTAAAGRDTRLAALARSRDDPLLARSFHPVVGFGPVSRDCFGIPIHQNERGRNQNESDDDHFCGRCMNSLLQCRNACHSRNIRHMESMFMPPFYPTWDPARTPEMEYSAPFNARDTGYDQTAAAFLERRAMYTSLDTSSDSVYNPVSDPATATDTSIAKPLPMTPFSPILHHPQPRRPITFVPLYELVQKTLVIRDSESDSDGSETSQDSEFVNDEFENPRPAPRPFIPSYDALRQRDCEQSLVPASLDGSYSGSGTSSEVSDSCDCGCIKLVHGIKATRGKSVWV